MFGKMLTRLLLLLAFLLAGIAHAADPTLHEVYQAAESGRMSEAQAMMDKVLRDHPNSAKAHFVEAELLAKQGRIAAAQGELATAERLGPGLPFAKPEAVQNLKARLANRVQPSTAQYVQPAQAPASSGFPWGMLLIGGALLAAVIFFVRSLSNRNNVTVVPAGAGYGPGGGTYGGGYGPGPVMQPGGGGMAMPQAGGGMGSGILGGLATGAAVGAGMVAGEALMHRVLDGGHHDAASVAPTPTPAFYEEPRPDTSSYDMGGNDFGVADGGSWDDGGSGGGGDDWT